MQQKFAKKAEVDNVKNVGYPRIISIQPPFQAIGKQKGFCCAWISSNSAGISVTQWKSDSQIPYKGYSFYVDLMNCSGDAYPINDKLSKNFSPRYISFNPYEKYKNNEPFILLSA